MKKYIFLLLAAAVFSACTHKEVQEESQPVAVVEEVIVEEAAPDISEDLIAVYNKLIMAIKKHDIDTILSCYTDNALYGYEDKLAGKFACYNEEVRIEGKQMLSEQYRFMIKKKILDNIEFEIKKIDQDNLSIGYINAWAVSDFGVAETIVFEKVENGYIIREHIIHRY